MQGIFGILVITALAWLMASPAVRLSPSVALPIVARGLAVQLLIAAVFLGIPQARVMFDIVGATVQALQNATLAGQIAAALAA